MRTWIRLGLKHAFRFLLGRVGKLVALPVRRQLRAFELATHQPQLIQEELLGQILRRHTDTDFARDHHFQSIAGVDVYRRHLPVSSYDYFEPYLARVRRGEFHALLADRRIHMFALTSGTTATRKFIPVTDSYLADYRRGWNMWGLKLFRDHPEVKFQPIVQMSGDWDEFRTEAGIPCGAVTGLTARMQKRLIRWLYCVPPCVGRIKDPRSKYYVALRLSIPRPVTMLIAANPSTVINLARTGDQEKEALLRDIHDGTLNRNLDLPDDIRAEITSRCKRKPERARELEAIVSGTGTLYPRDYWPQALMLGNWTGGSMGAYLRHYPRYYGERVIRDVGLIASEGRMTIPFADHTPSGILDITTHYYEFIPEAEGDDPHPTVLGAHELQQGQRYFILLTTSYGLYRYHIHDLVRCTGFYNQTPLIEFLSKGALFANITGEKLSEYHVTHTMAEVLADLELSLNTYSLVPCWDDEEPYYALFIEEGDLPDPESRQRIIRALDRRLHEMNVEYAAKRQSQRLGPIRLELLRPGAWLRWDRQRLDRTGGTLEQYKHPCLINDLDFSRSMNDEKTGLRPQGKNPSLGNPTPSA
jgi:hypothetical protein